MAGNERRVEAGPSDMRRQRNNQQASSSTSPFSWTMSLFGGRINNPSRSGTGNSSSGLGWGRPGASASARNLSERESLIPSGGDDFDDSDAISLLSNIADRDSRRGGSAAARRRARARAKAQGRTCGTLWFDLEDWSRSMSCGLLGRSGQADNAASAQRQRAASIGSVMSRGARRTNASTGSSAVLATSRHSRSLSDASTDSGGSLVGPGFAEDGDEDAGMLDDQYIARFGQPQPQATADAAAAEGEAAAAKAKAEAELKAQAEAEAEAAAAAERQKALEVEAARLVAEAEAEAKRQKEEEAQLAAQEEAAIAKARRKAERKAAKAGLLQLQQQTQAASRWRTEAEAEAAAGGFGLADAEDETQYYEGHEGDEAYAQQRFNYDDGYEEDGMHGGEYGQYGDAEEGAEGYYETVEERGPGGVVHHHHYYHAPTPQVDANSYGYVSPHTGSTGMFADAPIGHPTLASNDPPSVTAEAEIDAEGKVNVTDKALSEDEADIAGLSFGRKKKSRGANDNSSAGSRSRSGTGLTPRTHASQTGGSSSGGSASGHHAPASASSSATGRTHYRDRPRRHERTSSNSSNSSSGLFSYQSSNAIHPPPSTAATSVTSPLALPNLYESEAADTTATPAAERMSGEMPADDEALGKQFGKPDVESNEFGVITAGTNRGGAGRVKKSYRDKRSKSQLTADADGGDDTFEGFPGF